MFNNDLLENFLNIVNHGGFTAAAKATYSTQSTISAKLMRLEEQAGHRLMERNRRGVVELTTEGKEIEALARETMRMHALTRRRLNEQPISGVIKFGMSDDIASVGNYPQLLGEFSRRQPGIQLEVLVGTGPELEWRLDRGEIDHILCKVAGELPAEAVVLWREELVWLGDPETHANRPAFIKLVTFTPPCRYRERAIGVLEKAGMRWQAVYVTPSLSGVRAAVKAGLGVSLLPKSLVADPGAQVTSTKLPDAGSISFALLSGQNSDDKANRIFRALLEQFLPPRHY